MIDLEILEGRIWHLCLEYWSLLPEPKRPYKAWWYGINGVNEALNNLLLSADKEEK